MAAGRPDAALVAAVREALAAAGDPQRAAGQQRYMRSAMPFHGVTAPRLRQVVRPLLRAHPPADRETWEATVRALWDDATHREERYAALALAEHRAARPWQGPAVLDLYRHLVVTGAWWDLVDVVATRLVGGVLRAHREVVTPVMDGWAVADDLWLRRTAILSQLGHKEATDTALLERCVRANLPGSPFGDEFFVRKALGWALRQHARTDPERVLELVDELGDGLSGLSRREALRHLRG
ncbi:DNA alkylation repair protein [Ornithinimicrobium pekingense]|uniref:DNA alkylation repair protein n=1 Tax=Ornithinimicrobium pekingense TaxID=384677 RepID=A0ABQ2FGA3_9MICO|nr:DNA alkylation repair protein [Ornithinimicrobium pekingense]GGK83068.1 DNA alkylation repair protein [Ornithinimicrobium pekingense]